MLPQVEQALKLGFFGRIAVRLILRIAIKRLNKLGKGYFSRMLAFEVRQKIIAEILRQIEWAKRKTPDFEIDEQALQCAAWVLESDTIQREVNRKYVVSRDVHARWLTEGPAADRANP